MVISYDDWKLTGTLHLIISLQFFTLLYSADGRVTINTTIPDTITSWVASAFAVNSQTGLGVSPTTAKVGAITLYISRKYPRMPENTISLRKHAYSNI